MTIKMVTIYGYGKLTVKIVNHIPNYIYLLELRILFDYIVHELNLL